ncbi:MAG: transporter [Rubrivivax sp.]|nr:transporter [Rubrivivax sp.]
MNRIPMPDRAACGAALLMVAMVPASATEGGGTAKILGVETVMAGVMQAPGQWRVVTVVGHYRSEHTLDGNGNPRAPLSNFDLKVTAFAMRFQYVWPELKLLGADVESRFGAAWYTDTTLSFDVATPGGPVHRADASTGHGDALLAPITLGWKSPSLHQIAGLEIYVPWGRFDTSRLANRTRGYLAVAPAYRFTWFPAPALEVSGNLIYLLNRENPDTRVKSGRELSFDYGIGYTLAPGWQVGASGYLYRQVSDDTLRGIRVAPDGNRGRVAATGPFLRWYTSDGMGITLKWQVESGARNKTDGNRFFLQFARNL